jgi:hypothetical protein
MESVLQRKAEFRSHVERLYVCSATEGDKEQTDIRYYLSSLLLDVGVFAR